MGSSASSGGGSRDDRLESRSRAGNDNTVAAARGIGAGTAGIGRVGRGGSTVGAEANRIRRETAVIRLISGTTDTAAGEGVGWIGADGEVGANLLHIVLGGFRAEFLVDHNLLFAGGHERTRLGA